MLAVLDDEAERTETRLKAAQWLAERGFGKAPTEVEPSDGATTIIVKSAFDDDAESLAGVGEVLARAGVLTAAPGPSSR